MEAVGIRGPGIWTQEGFRIRFGVQAQGRRTNDELLVQGGPCSMLMGCKRRREWEI